MQKIMTVILTAVILLAGCSVPAKNTRQRVLSGQERIKSFCVDFNWDAGHGGEFAPPGMYAGANAAEHVRWYKELGANVIQTFAVNCCGYAWYPSGVAPVQPGLKGDFLGDVVRLGHQEDMLVIGYFCVGANTYWGQQHPELSHGIPAKVHIPLTNAYLDYLCASIQNALRKTAIDGIILDWFYDAWLPGSKNVVVWLDCEKQMWAELMGGTFPGEEHLDPESVNEYHRRAVDRAWRRVRGAVRAARSNCVIWLTAFDLKVPEVANSRMLREVDWLMSESPDTTMLAAARKMKGPKTRLIQCICGWGDQHDANKFTTDPEFADVGLYGFAAADTKTTLPPTESTDTWLAGNAKNVEIIRRAYNRPSR